VIVGSLLLILVAVALLVAGVLSGSNALIVCCMVLVVLAAIVLVIGVKQAAAAGVSAFADDDDEEDDAVDGSAPTGQFAAVTDSGFPRRQSDRRAADDTAESVPIRSRRGTTTASGSGLTGSRLAGSGAAGSGLAGGAAVDDRGPLLVDESVSRAAYAASDAPTGSIPSQGTVDVREPIFEAPSFEAAGYEAPSEAPGYEAPSYETPGYEPPGYQAAGYQAPGYEAAGYEAGTVSVDLDDDPPDEPSAQIVSAANAARVAMLTSDVLVVDGRPRYHVTGCVHLLGREGEPLPVGEAVELGFTPCGLCEPDSALLAEARRV
jgi:hypothetical protein